MAEESYTIGELARRMKLSPRTIDFYTRLASHHDRSPAKGYRSLLIVGDPIA